MRFTSHIFFSDDTEQEDDIDKLFRNLEQVEPPPSVIKRILSSISQLPQPVSPPAVPVSPLLPETPGTVNEAPSEATDSDESEHDPWNQLDGLVVRREEREPS